MQVLGWNIWLLWFLRLSNYRGEAAYGAPWQSWQDGVYTWTHTDSQPSRQADRHTYICINAHVTCICIHTHTHIHIYEVYLHETTKQETVEARPLSSRTWSGRRRASSTSWPRRLFRPSVCSFFWYVNSLTVLHTITIFVWDIVKDFETWITFLQDVRIILGCITIITSCRAELARCPESTRSVQDKCFSAPRPIGGMPRLWEGPLGRSKNCIHKVGQIFRS